MLNVTLGRLAHKTVGRILRYEIVGRALARQITKKKNLL